MTPQFRSACAPLVGLIAALTAPTASATLMDAIAALNPGDMYRVMFVTSIVRDATSTNILDYDQFVTGAAGAGSITNPLGLSWRAVASTDAVDAHTNTGILNSDNTPVSIFNTMGELLAVSGADLWDGSLGAPVGFNQDAVAEFGRVWTGTSATGVKTANFNMGDGAVTYGSPVVDSALWVNNRPTFNTAENALYGVSEKVTVPTVAVPEPTTVTLAGLALVVAALRRKRLLVA